jgi:hypothetical protein
MLGKKVRSPGSIRFEGGSLDSLPNAGIQQGLRINHV